MSLKPRGMDYEDFELQIGPKRGDDFSVRVLRSPEGQAEGLLRLPPLDDGSGDRELGARLYRALFHGAVGACFHQSLSRVGEDGSRGLRLRLRLNPKDRDLAPLYEVPWECLYRRETQDFLALNRRTAVVRTFDLPRTVRSRSLRPPLRIVVVLAQGSSREAPDLEAEARELEHLAAETPDLQVEILRDPELSALRRVLDRSEAHVLHFLGHGHFNTRTGIGALLLTGTSGGARKLDSRVFATKVKDLASLRLVVLNACDTARVSSDHTQDPFAGVATSLILGGIPAVIAMRRPITGRRASAFTVPFYAALAERRSLEEAVTEGRQGMLDLSSREAEWPIPVLFLSTLSGELLPPRSGEGALIEERSAPSERRPWIRVVGGVPAVLVGLLLYAGTLENSPLHGVWASLWGTSPSTEPVEEDPDELRSTTRAMVGELDLTFPEGLDFVTRTIFMDALRQSTASSPGHRISVTLSPPQLQPIQRAGFSGWSCRLAAVCDGLGTVQAVRSRAGKNEACELAARDLAAEIARKLAQHEQNEESS